MTHIARVAKTALIAGILVFIALGFISQSKASTQQSEKMNTEPWTSIYFAPPRDIEGKLINDLTRRGLNAGFYRTMGKLKARQYRRAPNFRAF